MNPVTVAEWKEYIQGFSGEALMSKAKAANCVAFVRSLEEDGLTAMDITAVLEAFGKQLVADGQEPPGRTEGSYVDYGLLVYGLNLDVEPD